MDFNKYKPYPVFDYKRRTWPFKRIEKAPLWCSVDLRDGNQALVVPMDLEQKIEFFKFLCRIGFKEIEIGFPAASDTEYIFTRKLIDDNLIPKDVTVQVLTQAREHIMEKTFEALSGAHRAVVHLYNSTSTIQREHVFKKSKAEIKELAVFGARKTIELADKYGRENFVFEYSPESFTGTEPDYAAEVINAVLEVWKPTPDNKVIINLPSTVEMSTPNVYADMVEYIINSIPCRDSVIMSLHTHNDRGCAIAATELGLLAGADRVEGTLFGNGERTGNADILTLAMNMYSQGIDMGLDFSNIDDVVRVYETATLMNVHERHPYAGELVFTAFSGSHQDAINKCLTSRQNETIWENPYLPIDPADMGRDYEAVIRINSQSGRGGVSYILERKFSLVLPKAMQREFSYTAKKESDSQHKELLADEIYALFEREYINLETPVSLVKYNEVTNGTSVVEAVLLKSGEEITVHGKGGGLIDAFCQAVNKELNIAFEIDNYSEHSLEQGTKSRAITYISIKDNKGSAFYGAGVSSSISKSSLKAVVSAVNRMLNAYS